MATPFLVLSALGADRPGLVADLTRFLVERGANVEESRMVTLGAEFGAMMLVSGAPGALERVRSELGALEASTGLVALCKPTTDPRARAAAAATLRHEIVLEAIDREGIVHALAAEVHRLGLNLVDVETSSYAAPFSGGELFRLEATVDVAPGKPARALREALEALAEREHLDIEIKSRS